MGFGRTMEQKTRTGIEWEIFIYINRVKKIKEAFC